MYTIGIAKLMCTIGIAKLGQTVAHYPTILLVFIALLYLHICTLSGKVPYLMTHICPLFPAKSGIMTYEREMCSSHRVTASIGTLGLIVCGGVTRAI